MSKKVGRNERCPCGSGKKYKNCCQGKENASNESESNDVLEALRKFNSFDLAKTFSALTLLPDNHGKNVRLEELTLKVIKDFRTENVEIKNSELIDFLDRNYLDHYAEDISVNPFTDIITFHGGDYLIYPGITEHSGYVLFNLLGGIFNWPELKIPIEFRNNCRKVSKLLLTISNQIAHKLNHIRYMEGSFQEEKIIVPNESILKKLKSAITLSKKEMTEILVENNIPEEVLDLFTIDLKDPETIDQDQIERKPLLRYGNEFLIFSPALISCTLTNFLIEHSKEFKIFDHLSNSYHSFAWEFVKIRLTELGFTRVELPEEIIELVGPHENIYCFDDNKLAYIQTVRGDDLDFHNRKQKAINKVLENPAFQGFQFLDILLVSSMGQDLMLFFEYVEKSKSIAIPIHDLDILSKLKKYNAIDIWKFTEAKEKLGERCYKGNSFLDLFKLYVENNNSFYLSDDPQDYKIFVIPGSSFDFCIKAKKLADEHSAIREINGRKFIIPVKRKEKFTPVYYSESDLGQRIQFLVEGFPQPIWIGTINDAHLIPEELKSFYFEMAEAIAFWLWQCQDEIFDKLLELGDDPIEINFELSDEGKFIFIERDKERDPTYPDHYEIDLKDNTVSIRIPPSILPYLYGADNEGERILLLKILEGLNTLIETKGFTKINHLNKIVDRSAPIGVKKKIFLLDTAENLLLHPTDLNVRYLQDYDVNIILDSIVPSLGDLCPSEGKIVSKDDKLKLTKNIVIKVLLPRLKTTIKKYQHIPLLKRLLMLNESLVREREELKLKTPTRIACFVSQEDQTNDLHDILSKLNQTVLAVRCLIEHIAAEPCTGDGIISMTAIDELVALMNAIIDWGSLGDQINYDLFETELSILPSKRVGVKKHQYKEIFDPFFLSKTKENVTNSIESFEQAFPKFNSLEGNDVPENLDKAFLAEFKISFTRICQFVGDLANIAYDNPDTIAAVFRKDLFIEINKFDNEYTEDEINNALSFLCLVNRGNVEVVPEGCDNIDISPWRFNRRLSLLRRPLVLVDNDQDHENPTIYWGLRQVLSFRIYLFDQCITNRLKVNQGGAVQKVIGKLSANRGKVLVEEVVHYLEDKNILIDQEVEIGPKSELFSEIDLGDVDVLVIDKRSKVIISVECKNLAPTRNIKEMIEEVAKMFGDESEDGYILKHGKRHDWLLENLDSIAKKYEVDLSGYELKSFFLTEEDLLTPYLHKIEHSMSFVTLYDLKEKGFDVFLD